MDNEKKGSYESNSTYLHNTKIASSDIQKEASPPRRKSGGGQRRADRVKKNVVAT